MKRTIAIIAGIVVVLLLIGIWAYILFTGTTSETVSFNDFGFGDTTDPSVIIPEQDPTQEQDLAIDPTERLRQLTTSPVAGFAETLTTSSTTNPTARYIEAGTGHIFSIDITTGETTRVSATTIPLTSKGVITPNGRSVLMQSGDGTQAAFTIGLLSSDSDRLSNFSLDEEVISFTATNNNELLYATPAGNSLTVKAYTPDTNQTRILFSVPFREATIAWHHTTAGPHIIYPKSSSRLEGYTYSYTDGVVDRIAASGYGLSAVGSTDTTIYGAQVDGTYQSFQVKNAGQTSVKTPLTFVPEKCKFSQNSPAVAICGASLNEFTHLFPDDWYQGKTVFKDQLWEYNTDRQSAQLLVSPENETGRQIDLINPTFSTNDKNVYFQNKIDQTLWMYEYVPTSN